jgi:ubiquinone/menaquinone biosynthesis C-methylase UbiE
MKNTDNFNEIIELIRDYLQQSKIVLDAGCGKGRYFEYFKNSFVVGLDIDRSSLRLINNTGAILQADVTYLPFKSNCFDLVFSRSVLEYVKRPKDAINEFKRVLKPNGYLIFSVPTKYSLFSIYRKILIKMNHYYGPEPVFLFTSKDIRKVLNQNFEVKLLTGYDIYFPRYVFSRYVVSDKINKFLFKLERKLPKWFLRNFAWEIVCVARKRKV